MNKRKREKGGGDLSHHVTIQPDSLMEVFDYGTNTKTGKKRNKCVWVSD
jgi:hypothetical protein